MHKNERLMALAAPYRMFPDVPAAFAPDPSDRAWQMDRLLAPLEMDELLRIWKRELGADRTSVAASLFVKTYARMLTAAWRLLSVGNSIVDMDLANVRLVKPENGPPALLLRGAPAQPLPAGPDARADARDRWLADIANGHVRLLLESVSFRSGLPMPVAWENVFIYLHHGYTEWARQAETPEERARIEGDYARLTARGSPFHLASGGSFDDPLHPGRELRIRRTCCLKYQLPGDGKPCYSCPMIGLDERIGILTQKKSP
ncbi:hypothetical protein SD70_30240 [Gordoniibacillus kamchatkensis]|uniref:Ferric siderophore reductase C-terminal domain-containing protein n=1 Tax=Gordoniibacillus kamchatkensis TaxID=1590651 RepID=A0ABR5AA37_9BACL|nr:(2Fe-2S)-binding protein [Paenibacillus sp. VKM B-2647]KIL37851.1 hypothetical protein SD70_30240 [Paenibacillus sp. VKM B-2647]